MYTECMLYIVMIYIELHVILHLFLQIEKAEFSCPSWFPVGVKSLIHRILDPNPDTVSIGIVTKQKTIR